jgi:hypothetical protein
MLAPIAGTASANSSGRRQRGRTLSRTRINDGVLRDDLPAELVHELFGGSKRVALRSRSLPPHFIFVEPSGGNHHDR